MIAARSPRIAGPFVVLRARPPPWPENIIGPPRHGDQSGYSRRRRVAPDLARETVSKVYGSKDESALIEQYIRRKYRLIEREGLFETEKELAAAYRRLLRAGFAPGVWAV